MASPANNPFDKGACLPCLNNDGHSEDLTAVITQSGSKPVRDIVPEMKETEGLLVSEMSKLSVQEIRAVAYNDVHCVGEELKETPEMVQKSLADFEQTLRNKEHQPPIYALAVNQDRAYVEDPSFRLKFLRANFHNVDNAVAQMMDFLRNKAKYFCEDKVAREIRLADLTQEEIALLLSARIYVQEGRDRMERPIVHTFDHTNKLGTNSAVSRTIKIL